MNLRMFIGSLVFVAQLSGAASSADPLQRTAADGAPHYSRSYHHPPQHSLSLSRPTAGTGAGRSGYVPQLNRIPERCRNAEDARCEKAMENELARQLRARDYHERAALGGDYCLFFRDEPRCRADDRRDSQRSHSELRSYCGMNPDAPRCIGMHLSPNDRAEHGLHRDRGQQAGESEPGESRARQERRVDDFFGGSNNEASRRGPGDDEPGF